MLLKKIIALTLLSLFPGTLWTMSKSNYLAKALLTKTPCFLLGSTLGMCGYVAARTIEQNKPDLSRLSSDDLRKLQLLNNQNPIKLDQYFNENVSSIKTDLPPAGAFVAALLMPGLVKPTLVGIGFGALYFRYINNYVLGDVVLKICKHTTMEKSLQYEIEKRSN